MRPQFLCYSPFLLYYPRLHLIFLNAPFGLKPNEEASCSLLYPLLNLSNKDYGAKRYTRAECNTILYDPRSLRGCIIFIYVSVSVYVYVNLTWHCWLPFSILL